MGKRPMIGITPGFTDEKNRMFISKGYVEGVNQAGGFAVLLPLSVDETLLGAAIDRCDGFLLSGGPDIDARYFGELNYPFNGSINPARDEMEIYIAQHAVEAGKPVLGICRGIQVLNVALGGSLYQDIHSQIKDRDLLKHSQEAPEWYPIHDVSIVKDSKLWSCYGKENLGVNSFHHQAVKIPGKGLQPVSWSPDGIIEAVEHENHVFAVGVQWHPELMWQMDIEALKLFEAFVGAALR
ncbi:MAG: gamma-glutamyl-gamma-aminobutyrate hydrolase family protein [Ruminiclostridium sp.]|nr:gamma-glutamyl-gamma-aminobutyrate hydrolase family protein [Ruminiclostridium sp.]